jgi:elongation factor G
VSYRESITKTVQVEGRYIKQTGGSGDFAVVVIQVSPAEAGIGFVFESVVKRGNVPSEYIPAVKNGCEAASQSGPLAGYPMVDVSVKLLDGQAHDVDSSERSFKIAASMAMKDALEKAKPVLLEPIMSVEAVTPEEFVGSVQGDLNSRRGSITGIEAQANAQAIEAEVPLATMFGYVNNLRSLTQGRATYTMEFSHYAEVPASVAQGIVYS